MKRVPLIVTVLCTIVVAFLGCHKDPIDFGNVGVLNLSLQRNYKTADKGVLESFDARVTIYYGENDTISYNCRFVDTDGDGLYTNDPKELDCIYVRRDVGFWVGVQAVIQGDMVSGMTDPVNLLYLSEENPVIDVTIVHEAGYPRIVMSTNTEVVGEDILIFVNVRPRPIQYNRMSNPSRCHFGIIGQIYNIGTGSSPSMVDILKPYAYLYDATIDKLYKLLESNLGKLTVFDTASVPDTWKVEKWLHFAKVNHLAVRNSFNEGRKGSATGKLYGAMNNNTTGVIDASLTNEIQFNIQLLDWLDTQMGKACGISPQREGQISNRETVGGVERATLQSSHITEYIFAMHDNLKKRVMEAFLETANIAMKGRKEKFKYITSTGASLIMEIDGDDFAECDYGIVVDSSQGTQLLTQKLDTLAQAGLQNQMFNFSTMMKLYSTDSIQDKIRMLEAAERRAQELQQQAQEQATQLQQQQIEAQAREKQAELEQKELQNQRDNETRILVAQIQAQANIDSSVARASGYNENPVQPLTEKDRLELQAKMREVEERNRLDREKLQVEREKIKSQERIAKQKKSA